MKRLNNFLERFISQREAGLVVIEPGSEAEVAQQLSAQGFVVSDSIAKSQDLLLQGASVAILLHEELAKDLYDLLGDYAEPVGLIQTVDAQTLKVSLKAFNRERTKLLVVATEASLSSTEKRLLISERVGMIERLP